MIKTVRTDEHVATRFLQKYQNFRLIHILRDPRGVTLSRMKKQWAQGLFERGNLTHIAKTYCQNVLKDYVRTVILRNRYEGRVIHVVTDGVMRNLDENTKALFRFVDMTMLYEAKMFIQNNTLLRLNGEGTSDQRINVWQAELTRIEMRSIAEVCQNLFRDLKYDWFYTKTT